MKIGIILNQIGGCDGVSLEAEKWISILNHQGHDIYLLTGDTPRPYPQTTVLSDITLHHSINKELNDNIFFNNQKTENKPLKDLDNQAEKFETIILTWIDQNDIDCLLFENTASHPNNVALGWGISRVINKTNIPNIAHHHISNWDVSKWPKSNSEIIQTIIKNSFPIKYDQTLHIVNNTNSVKQLQTLYNIEAIAIPNVMNFNKPYGIKDIYNDNIKTDLNIPKKNKVVLYATPCLRNKNIETAIELVKDLGKKFSLLITDSDSKESDENYRKELIKYIKNKKMDKNVIFATGYFGSTRQKKFNGQNVYSISDAYAQSDLSVLVSHEEGFGHQIVESIAAKVPFVSNNYAPSFIDDIASKGFEYFGLKNGIIDKSTITKIKQTLADESKIATITNHNHKIGKKYFSIDKLSDFLQEVFGQSTTNQDNRR